MRGLRLSVAAAVAMLAVSAVAERFCVIDLRGGPTAAAYPVAYRDSVPAGGWSDEFKTDFLVLKRVEGGKFLMGRGADMAPDREVTLTEPFYLGVFEVTQRQYALVTGTEPPWCYGGSTRPVAAVSYRLLRGDTREYDYPASQAVSPHSFFGRLREKTGLKLDLPTEAQWEYTCRAGASSRFNNGGDAEADLLKLGRFAGNRNDGRGGEPGWTQYAAVGSYLPNAWGFYDFHGNVAEWCLDWAEELSQAAVTDPVGPATGEYRVLRGGYWYYGERECRASARQLDYPESSDILYGFRVAGGFGDER